MALTSSIASDTQITKRLIQERGFTAFISGTEMEPD